MLVTAKPKLQEQFKEICSFKTSLKNDQKIGVVIDGRHLMYTMVNWQKQSSFIEIADKYVHFVMKKYSRSGTIVFDNYSSESTTKIHAHNFRRKKNGTGPEVEVSAGSKLAVSKTEFLSNNMNKQRFIHFLSERFKHFGVKTVQDNDDADLLIAQTAIAKAQGIPLNVNF